MEMGGPIRFSCPRCGQDFTAPRDRVGQVGRCGSCQARFQLDAVHGAVALDASPAANSPEARPPAKRPTRTWAPSENPHAAAAAAPTAPAPVPAAPPPQRRPTPRQFPSPARVAQPAAGGRPLAMRSHRTVGGRRSTLFWIAVAGIAAAAGGTVVSYFRHRAMTEPVAVIGVREVENLGSDKDSTVAGAHFLVITVRIAARALKFQPRRGGDYIENGMLRSCVYRGGDERDDYVYIVPTGGEAATPMAADEAVFDAHILAGDFRLRAGGGSSTCASGVAACGDDIRPGMTSVHLAWRGPADGAPTLDVAFRVENGRQPDEFVFRSEKPVPLPAPAKGARVVTQGEPVKTESPVVTQDEPVKKEPPSIEVTELRRVASLESRAVSGFGTSTTTAKDGMHLIVAHVRIASKLLYLGLKTPEGETQPRHTWEWKAEDLCLLDGSGSTLSRLEGVKDTWGTGDTYSFGISKQTTSGPANDIEVMEMDLVFVVKDGEEPKGFRLRNEATVPLPAIR